ncbi:uncharacterized protein LOC110023772 isoform X2 [Phalaenopsis equestris]|uniref:uncharacterized protein LOC110023772 isoform X2 n=1 Tax=Phalaenopsis equestris TaxID=78828 RepID=UPI0009E25BA3|nr:uncharacterized protein LOC110023772 isoform X2 [Phalaenopsis equestris]
MAPKSTTLLFMIISTLLLSVCTLDGHRILIENSVAGTGLSEELQDEEVSYVHSRMLAVRTNDYQNYDPSPAFVKPPYKLIPN